MTNEQFKVGDKCEYLTVSRKWLPCTVSGIRHKRKPVIIEITDNHGVRMISYITDLRKVETPASNKA